MFRRLKENLLLAGFLVVFGFALYHQLWGRYLYLVTAYCDCPICINVPAYRDGRFANGKEVYWGGAAADPKVKFGSRIELMPQWPRDWKAVRSILKGRRRFVVEDRGSKIKGRHIDLFIPDRLGGHQAAKRWGARRMRIKINKEWAR
jgi:3D (Asp-Asp-Asp) domain-containing protein